MLLTRIARRLRRNEDGQAMVAVMGLMAVSLLTTALIASSIVTSTAFTTTTRAGVQSQAAAEAGIAAARAGLLTGTCAAEGHSYESDVEPRYVATVWVPSGSGWVRGCPPGTATQVRVLSTGYADAEGVVGASGRDETTLELVLSAASIPTSIDASGPAIYAYNSSGFGGGGKLISVDGSSPEILIKEGDVTCTGGASGQADIVVNNGNLTVSSGCSISGNVWASGRVIMPGGPNVGGNVVANAITISGGSQVGKSVWVHQDATLSGGAGIAGDVTAGSMSFTSGGTVGGDADVAGHVQFTGGTPDIKGDLTAASFTATSSGHVRGDAWIYGAMSLNWTTKFYKSVTVKSVSLPGSAWQYNRYDFFVSRNDPTIIPGGPGTSPYVDNAARPATPFVPNWVDFDLDLGDWTGFAAATITSSGSCSYAQVLAAVNSFAGQPGVIDATGCVGGVYIGGADKVPLTADLAIFANKFNLTEGGGFTATSTKRLWLLTPDNTPDGLPTCTTGDNSYSITGGFTFSSSLQVMMYTPCKVLLASGINVRGQVFSGKAGIDGGATLGYVPVGLPGVNLDTGATQGGSTTEADRLVVSLRNVTAGG